VKKGTIIRIYIVAFIYFSASAISKCQESIEKSILSNFSGIYNDPSGYLNGRRNTFIYPPAIGNPWFMMAGQVNSMLETEKGTYHDLLLSYDILNDELILTFRDTAGMESIMINKNIIYSFSLFGVRFVNLDAGLLPESGFYEEVYNGNLKFYIKHKKILIRQSGPVQYEYRYKTLKYLVRDNKYYLVNNNRALLKTLGDKKSEVKSFLQEHQILVRSASNNELISVLKHYEGI
jgi:hypothetical protein